MKLIFCPACQDVIRLIEEEERFCRCGLVSGKYLDDINAIYKGFGIPIGFSNRSFVEAITTQQYLGDKNSKKGREFIAFIIPDSCKTFVKQSS